MRYMKYLVFSALVVLAACAPKVGTQTSTTTTTPATFRSAAPKPGPARPVEIGEYHHFTLDNGLKVIVVENHKLPQISYQLTIDRDEMLEKEKSGLAGIAGSLLATGTTTKTKAEIDEAVDYIGANLSTNATGGFASSLTKHTDKVLALFSEVILQPSFPQQEFDKLKTQTLSGLQANKDDPNAISQNVSRALTYGMDHPYGEITNEITVSNISLEDAQDYYKTYFKPGNAYLVVVGDITPEVAKSKAQKYFGKWSSGQAPEYEYSFPKTVNNTAVAFVDKAGAVQSVINITYPIQMTPGHPDEIPARVMNTILGSGFSGRLFRNLREDKAYTYGAYSNLESDELVGSFSASASVRNEVTDSAIHEFLYELNKLRTEPVTKTELDLAKSYIAGAFARSLESPQTVAGFARRTLMYNLPEDYYETYLQKLQAVTVEDVTRMANKYVTPVNARIVVVGNKDEVMPKLVVFDKEDGKVQLYDVYANPRKDEATMPVNLTPEQILNNYFTAIGGREKLDMVKSMEQTYSMELMGMSITTHVAQEDGKFYMAMTAPGMTLMKQVYNGEKGYVEQGGGRMPLEGNDLAAVKEQAHIFSERDYTKEGYALEVKGLEDVNGKPAYKLQVIKPSGTKSTEYYDKETFLKVKEVMAAEGAQQPITNEYSEYKNVNGVMIPHVLTISGAMPVPMVMTVTTVKVNEPVDQDLFKI